MDKFLSDYLSTVVLGEPKTFRNMAVVPLFTLRNGGPDYLTLRTALEKNLLTVAEVSLSGSVPELRVTNHANQPILLVDGEELAGAKQNRVLNSSILLFEKKETVIPVTCTEQGRWAYASRHFSHSGHIMASKLRKLKSASVAASLKMHSRHASDQHAVWNAVHQMANHAEVNSPTSAMHDVFNAKAPELDAYLQAFQSQPTQKGVLVFVNGEVEGLDVFSKENAYRELHTTLIRSYAIDALLDPSEPQPNQPVATKGSDFLAAVSQCTEKQFPSVGYGADHRFEGQKVAGAALVSQDSVIHLTAFRTD